jgi:drug/metabolite transporter (DMT)-like permease
MAHYTRALPVMKTTRVQLVLGFLCVYIVWGSTYLAIRIAVATIPPFILGAVRFLVAGTALYLWARLRGASRPTREEWRSAFIIGFLLLLIGNGAVVWSEQRVSSGIAALLVATVPLWLVLLEVWQGRRPAALQWVGVATGLGGVGLLMVPSGNGVAAVSVTGALVLTAGALSWTVGSMFARSAPVAKSASMASGMQMLCGGALMSVAAAASGELHHVDIGAISASSVIALAYLVVVGSIIAFSTYMWLLTVASPVAVGTYAYVNPAVAVGLGVVFAGETLLPTALAAMIVIVASVALMSVAPYLRRRAAEVA